MKKRYEILIISLLLLFIAELSSCQDSSYFQANSSGATENRTISASLPISSASASSSMIGKANAASAAAFANTNPSESNPSESQNLKYIWTITGIESDQVTMALDQDGQDLFGQAKYEPDSGEPWNGNVAGFINGSEVHLLITALKGDKQISTALDGTFENDAISGRFFKTGEGRILDRGTFNAVWINPDLTSYTPADIKETKAETEPQAANSTAAAHTAFANQMPQQKTIYHDVHQDADRVLTGVGDISQIPIGMGGSGLP